MLRVKKTAHMSYLIILADTLSDRLSTVHLDLGKMYSTNTKMAMTSATASSPKLKHYLPCHISITAIFSNEDCHKPSVIPLNRVIQGQGM